MLEAEGGFTPITAEELGSQDARRALAHAKQQRRAAIRRSHDVPPPWGFKSPRGKKQKREAGE